MTKHFDSNGYITTSVQYDEGEDTMIVGSHQDVRPVMDDISARNNDGTAGYGPSRDLRHKASIPLALYDDWLRDAYRQGIPIYHKRERDDWLKKRIDQHEGLKISGKATGRVGFSGGYGNAMQAKPNVTMKA